MLGSVVCRAGLVGRYCKGDVGKGRSDAPSTCKIHDIGVGVEREVREDKLEFSKLFK